MPKKLTEAQIKLIEKPESFIRYIYDETNKGANVDFANTTLVEKGNFTLPRLVVNTLFNYLSMGKDYSEVYGREVKNLILKSNISEKAISYNKLFNFSKDQPYDAMGTPSQRGDAGTDGSYILMKLIDGIKTPITADAKRQLKEYLKTQILWFSTKHIDVNAWEVTELQKAGLLGTMLKWKMTALANIYKRRSNEFFKDICKGVNLFKKANKDDNLLITRDGKKFNNILEIDLSTITNETDANKMIVAKEKLRNLITDKVDSFRQSTIEGFKDELDFDQVFLDFKPGVIKNFIPSNMIGYQKDIIEGSEAWMTKMGGYNIRINPLLGLGDVNNQDNFGKPSTFTPKIKYDDTDKAWYLDDAGEQKEVIGIIATKRVGFDIVKTPEIIDTYEASNKVVRTKIIVNYIANKADRVRNGAHIVNKEDFVLIINKKAAASLTKETKK